MDNRRALPAGPRSRIVSRDLRFAIGAAALLVVARSVLPLAYEQFNFDSDQAIVGLMAKHLSELRDFPLFFYGQNYMLGVQSWIAAPFFRIGGPTILMLKLPLLFINIAVATTLIVMLARRGVPAGLAFVASLPLITTTPVVSAALFATLGASIEPFLYLLILWGLRRRPLAFGAVLCFGTLHREFTIFALPAIAVASWIEGRRFDGRSIVRGAIAFAGVWLCVDVLKRALGGGPLFQEAQTIGRWLSLHAGGYLPRLQILLTIGLPDMFGGHAFSPTSHGVNSALLTGSRVAGLALAAAGLTGVCRLLWIARRREDRPQFREAAFALYLGLVALETLAAYGTNDGIDPQATPLLRYFLFGLLLPVAVFWTFFLIDRVRFWRIAVSCAIAVWAALTFQDNVRVFREYRVAPPESKFRGLADFLVARRIEYGRAQYWDCYIVDFLSRERVILASTGKVRIPAYQTAVDQHQATAVFLEREPCSSGSAFRSWCIEDPLKRVDDSGKR
jgi:hypothetical protein